MQSAWTCARDAAASAYRRVVFGPLVRLYLRGPAVNGWGFWGGRPVAEVCATASNVAVEFWERNPEVCAMLVERNVDGMVVAFETVVYYALLVKLACAVSSWALAWLTRPA